MHSGFTGIHLTGDHITAVQITRGFGAVQVTGCAHIQMNGDAPLEKALETLSKTLSLKGECSVGLPETHVFYRNITLPFKDKKKQREVLPFELETGIAFPVEEAVMDFTPASRSDGNEILVAFTRKAMLEELLTPFETLGIFPEILGTTGFAMASRLLRHGETPDNGLLMNMDQNRATLVFWQHRRVALIRNIPVPEAPNAKTAAHEVLTAPLCQAAGNTLHAFSAERPSFSPPERVYFAGPRSTENQTLTIAGDIFKIPCEAMDLLKDSRIALSPGLSTAWNPEIMDGALSLAMAGHGPDAGCNLRQGEFEIDRQSFFKSPLFRKIALWVLIIGVLWGFRMAVDIHFLKEQKAFLDQEIERVFRRTFPEVTRIVDPVKQARIKIRETRKKAVSGKNEGAPARALDLLLEISRKVPKSLDLKVTRLTVDPYAIRIKGSTDTYNTVDQIKQNLTGADLFKSTTITSANLDRDRKKVLFEIKLER